MRVLFVIALSALLVSCGGQIRTATAAPTATAAATGADAVMAAIEAANTAQARAFSTGDASLMRATATTAYFAELMQTNRRLASAGVRSFELVRIDWVDVTADGATAHATTDETWRTTFADGSTDERTDRNEYALVRESGAWKIQSDVQPAAHQIDPAPAPAPRVAPTQVGSTSSNWSGYVATGGIFTSVTGTWMVPNVSPNAPGADATWVGIGGMGSSDLIQAGTQAAVGGGSVEYTAWTETLPQASQTVPLAVRPGDSVTVTLTERPGAQWGIAIVNNTTRETYKTTVPYTSSHASAEWIEEAPSAGRGIVPLDDFGAVRFTQSTAVRDGTAQTLAALGARSVAMINGARQAIAQPSALDASGAGFTVTRTAASAVGGGTRPPRRRG